MWRELWSILMSQIEMQIFQNQIRMRYPLADDLYECDIGLIKAVHGSHARN